MKSELFIAAEKGNISMFRIALSKGKYVNEVDENGTTPLMIACKLGHLQLVKFIISKGAEINLTDKTGHTAIYYAEMAKKKEIVLFLKEGLDIPKENDANSTMDFDLLGQNLLPTLKKLQKLVIALDKDKRELLKEDFINIIYLFRKNETFSIYDGFGLLLVIRLFSNPQKLDTNLEGICDFKTIENTIDEFLILMNECKKDVNVSENNFELNSFSFLSSENSDTIRKIFHEFSEIIVKADGIVTEDEANTLKFLSNYFYKEGNKRATATQTKEVIKPEIDSLLKELNSLVGMENIKNDIRSLINVLNINKFRKKEGLPELKPSLHSVFIGPPGTGKTTIARILSNIYHSLEILPENNFVETDRIGLVGGYLGQTAIKTDEVISQAKNGILFIDEAYTLKRGNSDDSYGQEAIDIILKRMEDSRDSLIIIVAGYENEMMHFIDSNPGLKSRFNRYFYFKDYDPTELTEIYKRTASQQGLILKGEAEEACYQLFETLYFSKDDKFGNARLARNIFEKTYQKHANRIASIAPMTREILTTIEAIDIPVEEFIKQKAS